MDLTTMFCEIDDFCMDFEPHYEVISQPGQVQIYEGVMLNTDNQVTFTLLRAAKYAKDNRLLPDGFDKSTAHADIAVFGKANDDPDFTGGSDRLLYRIETDHQGPVTLTVRLLYTPLSYPFAKDLAKDGDLSLVKRFLYFYRNADKMPQEVAAIRTVVR